MWAFNYFLCVHAYRHLTFFCAGVCGWTKRRKIIKHDIKGTRRAPFQNENAAILKKVTSSDTMIAGVKVKLITEY